MQTRAQIRKKSLALSKKLHLEKKSLRLDELKRFNGSVAWNSTKLNEFRQTVIPAGGNTAAEIGIKPKSKVLVFAGFAGDWARGLAQSCDVHYTDASSEITTKVKTSAPGKIKTFKAMVAHLKPQRPNVYDWTVSFEPYPVQMMQNQFRLTLARGLLNKKGLKIIYAGGVSVLSGEEFRDVSLAYGAKFSSEYKTVKTQVGSKRKVGISTLLTNPIARKKAWLDIRMLNIISKNRRMIETPSRANLRKAFKATDEEISSSIKRVNFLYFGNTNVFIL